MADPVKRPLAWSKAYPAYAEKHDMYRVFQELLKDLIITKPPDPLAYIRDELPNVARTLHSPRVFIVGPNLVTQGIGRNMAAKCGAKFLTLAEIVEASPPAIRSVLTASINEKDKRFEENVWKLLVSTVKLRLTRPDCQKNGYVLFGFPLNRMQAKTAQQTGLLPREVYILMPDPASSSKPKNDAEGDAPEPDSAELKEVAEAYDFEICKVIPFEKWSSTKKQDIEGELLANLAAVKPCGSPWVPKILILGPPSSGRSTVADSICEKYSFVNVDIVELIRGGATLDDAVGKACKKYLDDLQPMNDDLMKQLIKRRMMQKDCELKGWVLQGFPDTARQLKILDMLQLTPNRVFLLYCPEAECTSRLQQKRNEIMKRKLSGSESNSAANVDERNFGKFPYGKASFRIRFDAFAASLPEITAHYGAQVIYVDATQKLQAVAKFMEDAVLRPPIARFPDPSLAT